MKKFLRCKACGKLLSPEGKWVENVREAWQFDSPEQIQKAVEGLNLPSVDLYYSFEDEFQDYRWDFRVVFQEGAEGDPAANLPGAPNQGMAGRRGSLRARRARSDWVPLVDS